MNGLFLNLSSWLWLIFLASSWIYPVYSAETVDSHWLSPSPNFQYQITPESSAEHKDGSILSINSGEALVEVKGPMSIKTPMSEVYATHKAMLYLRIGHGMEHFFVLWDSNPKSISVVSEKTAAKVGVGEEIVICDFMPRYQFITNDNIGRRRMVTNMLGQDKYMVTSEFSLLQASSVLPLLKEVLHSRDPHDHALSERVIKSAAILESVQMGHGAYHRSHSN
jgi:hypothetical protein